MADPLKRVLFPEEKLAELQQLISNGQDAEKILRSPIWGRIFLSMKETYVMELVHAKETLDVMSAKAKITALMDIQQVLGSLFTKAKAASHQPNDDDKIPARDVKPRKRVQ